MKNLPPIDALSYKPLREQVYELLRESILTGLLDPGEPLSEIKLADQLNVSRTPVREALRLLQLENLITISPRRGAVVTGITSKKEIDDLFKILVELESLAVVLAIDNIKPSLLKKLLLYSEQIEECVEENNINKYIKLDTTFHLLIYEATNNDALQKILVNLFEQTTKFRRASLTRPGRIRAALDEHKQLIAAISKHQHVPAKKLGVNHIKNAWLSITQLFVVSDEKTVNERPDTCLYIAT